MRENSAEALNVHSGQATPANRLRIRTGMVPAWVALILSRSTMIPWGELGVPYV